MGPGVSKWDDCGIYSSGDIGCDDVTLDRRKRSSGIKRVETPQGVKYIFRDEHGRLVRFGLNKGWEREPIDAWVHEFSEKSVKQALDKIEPGSGGRQYYKFYNQDGRIIPVRHTFAHAAVSHHTKSGIAGVGMLSPGQFEEFFWHSSPEIERKYPRAVNIFKRFTESKDAFYKAVTNNNRSDMVRYYRIARDVMREGIRVGVPPDLHRGMQLQLYKMEDVIRNMR